jgi:hypothetical protein
MCRQDTVPPGLCGCVLGVQAALEDHLCVLHKHTCNLVFWAALVLLEGVCHDTVGGCIVTVAEQKPAFNMPDRLRLALASCAPGGVGPTGGVLSSH